MKNIIILAATALILLNGCQKSTQAATQVEIIGIKLGELLSEYDKYLGEEKKPGVRAFSWMYYVGLPGYRTPDNWLVEVGIGPSADFQKTDRVAFLDMARELPKECDSEAVDELIKKLQRRFENQFPASILIPLSTHDRLRLLEDKADNSQSSNSLRFTGHRKEFIAASQTRMLHIVADCHHRHENVIKLTTSELDLNRYQYKDPEMVSKQIIQTLDMIKGYNRRKI